MSNEAKWLFSYMQLLEKEGTLEFGTVTPNDCEFIVRTITEMRDRAEEFAL